MEASEEITKTKKFAMKVLKMVSGHYAQGHFAQSGHFAQLLFIQQSFKLFGVMSALSVMSLGVVS